ETSFAQCVSEWLGVPFESVRLVQGDTDIIPVGGGSHSGRSMRMAGVCMGNAANGVIERSRQIAAHMFKLEPKDIEFSNGSFKALGSGPVICLVEVARAAQGLKDLDDARPRPLPAQIDV